MQPAEPMPSIWSGPEAGSYTRMCPLPHTTPTECFLWAPSDAREDPQGRHLHEDRLRSQTSHTRSVLEEPFPDPPRRRGPRAATVTAQLSPPSHCELSVTFLCIPSTEHRAWPDLLSDFCLGKFLLKGNEVLGSCPRVTHRDGGS